MALPLIPIIKVLALGLVKIVVLFIGALFFPTFTLRLLLGGASGMLIPVLDWLVEQGRLAPERHQAILEDIETLSAISYTRREARMLLFIQIKKTLANLVDTIMMGPRWLLGLFRGADR